MSQNYVYENGQVFSLKEVITSTQTAIVKVYAPNVTYDSNTNTFTDNTPIPDPLAEAKVQKIIDLQMAYQNAFTTFRSSALGTVHTYPYNEEAQKNFSKYTSLLAVNPNMATINFKTIENGMTAHTRDQFVQVLMDADAFEVNLAKKYEGYESQVNAATTVQQVQAITWS